MGHHDNSEDNVKLILTYMSILLFTVFFLNIFIGVIGQNYSCQEAVSHLSFQRDRAEICRNFIFRACLMPTNLCGPWQALCIVIVSFGCLIAVVLLSVNEQTNIDCTLVFALFQALILCASYQNRDVPWL